MGCGTLGYGAQSISGSEDVLGMPANHLPQYTLFLEVFDVWKMS